ncbi:MAG: YfhO family protein [Bacteroidota bacterium]|jgi:hypothetical protein
MAKAKQPNPRQREQQPSWFDKLSPLKKDLVCIAAMYVLVLILFNKIIFSNMAFTEGGDNANAIAWQKAADHVIDTEHNAPLWIPYAFSGMPGFGSLAVSNWPKSVTFLESLLLIPGHLLTLYTDSGWEVWHYFLAGVFMFLLARGLRFSQMPSLLAALTLMLNPYAIGLSQAGQGSKLMALSYIPLLFLLTYRLFQQRNILNFGLLTAVVGTMLLTNHVQMAFYGFLVIGCYVLYEVILEIKHQPVESIKKVLLFTCALAIGFAISAFVYLSVNEYQPYSIRGGGEAGVSGGLNYDYATNWSFHPFETLTYIIPSFFGFSSDYVTDWQGQQQALPLYWGWMPFTISTVYIGILPIILGIVALVYRRNRMTVFLAVFSCLVWFLSFGNHFPLVYNLFFNYLPYFNKFRAPSMILHLMPITFGLLAAYGASFLIDLPDRPKEVNLVLIRKRLMMALGVLGGLLVVGLILKGAVYSVLSGSMFVKEGDPQQFSRQVLEALKEKRFDVLFGDYVKFTILTGAIVGLIAAYITRKVQRTFFALGLIAILVVDLAILDDNYVDPKPPTSVEQAFVPDATINFLKTDTTYYRIFPVGTELFRDRSYTFMANFIPSIGGYSPAKPKIYQEMIDSVGLFPPRFPMNMNVLNMLSTKYIVAPGRLPETNLPIVNVDKARSMAVYLNPNYLPHAWFVDSIVVARSKHEVFEVLNSASFDARHVAILEKEPALRPAKPDSVGVTITAYRSRQIKLDVSTTASSLLVLSEVYYPAGWKAFIDGKETEIYKTNYVLRSILVPPGKHAVEFRFDPPAYELGYNISLGAWGVTLVLIIVGLFQIPAVKARFGGKREEKEPAPIP